MEKEDELEILIEDMGTDGEGIGHGEDGYTLFVKGGLPGDRVRVKIMKAKKNYAYARLVEIISPSPDRVEPVCAVASKCGGCQIQHLNYEKQLEYKQNKIKNCLMRIGGFSGIEALMEPIMGMENPFFYRNKAQFPVGKDKNGELKIGFYAGRTHSIVDISGCCIQAPVNEEILKVIRRFIQETGLEPYDEKTHTGLVRHILTRVGFVTGEIMVCLVVNGEKIPFHQRLVEMLTELKGMKSICMNVNRDRTNVILGEKVITLWGQDYITDLIGAVKYQISPLSFYQVNPVQTKKLYETALEFADLHGDEVVWDVYCGIGTISLFLAQKARMVYGVEIIPQAVEDAKLNSKLNGIVNAEFFVGAAEVVLPGKYEESRGEMTADVIVVDPPRKGCDAEVLDTIVKVGAKKVVYISCDPATLARDLRHLGDRGYEVKRVRGCDLFGQGVHIEVVIQMTYCGDKTKNKG